MTPIKSFFSCPGMFSSSACSSSLNAPFLSVTGRCISLDNISVDVFQFHREFKLLARKDKEEYLTEKCSEMESNYKHGRTRECFTVIKEITGKFRPKYSGILDENKQLVSSGEEVKQRWQNYTEALYIKNSSITCSPMTTESSDFLHEMEPEILESEIRSAIAQLPNRKSPGIDGIPIELIKALGDRGTRMIHEMCNEIWRTGEWPQQW